MPQTTHDWLKEALNGSTVVDVATDSGSASFISVTYGSVALKIRNAEGETRDIEFSIGGGPTAHWIEISCNGRRIGPI